MLFLLILDVTDIKTQWNVSSDWWDIFNNAPRLPMLILPRVPLAVIITILLFFKLFCLNS